jgi:integrase
MGQPTITTELVRQLRHQAPTEITDYRDPRLPGFVLRARPTGVHSWRVQLPNRRWLTIGRVDEIALSDARETAQTRRAQAALGQDIPTRRPTSDVTLRVFLDDTYEAWMKSTYGKRTTQPAQIRSAFRDLLDLKLSEFTTARVERWRIARKFRHAGSDAPTKRRAREIKRSTVNRNIAALRAALNRATEWGVLSSMPLGKIEFRAEDENAVVRYLSEDEESRLRGALVARDNARRAARQSANEWRRKRGYKEWAVHDTYTDYLTPLVLLAINTGLRRGELLQLTWRDLDLQRRILTVRGEGAKTGQTRHVPLNSEAIRVMKAWRSPVVEAAWLVFGGASETAPLFAVKKAWRGVLNAAKVTSFRFHDLRHTFASKLVMSGVDLNTVRELLGHKSLTMTLRYAHLAPEHKAAAVETLVMQQKTGEAA